MPLHALIGGNGAGPAGGMASLEDDGRVGGMGSCACHLDRVPHATREGIGWGQSHLHDQKGIGAQSGFGPTVPLIFCQEMPPSKRCTRRQPIIILGGACGALG